jgi:hypothetical protein
MYLTYSFLCRHLLRQIEESVKAKIVKLQSNFKDSKISLERIREVKV